MLKWVTIIAAVLGIPLALWAVVASTRPAPALAPDESPPVNPFPRGLAAPGTIEAGSRNIRVAAPEPGLIAAVFVQVNDAVKPGDRLFQLDPRPAEADLARAGAGVEVSRRALERLRAMPRAEDVARLEAALGRAAARLDHRRRERERAQRIRSRGALSEQELGEADLALDEAVADRAQAQAELDLVRAGSWRHDLTVAEADLRRAEAEVEAIRRRLDRLTVRSPIAGTILKRHVEPGESAPAGDRPALVVGDLSALTVRAAGRRARRPPAPRRLPRGRLQPGPGRGVEPPAAAAGRAPGRAQGPIDRVHLRAGRRPRDRGRLPARAGGRRRPVLSRPGR